MFTLYLSDVHLFCVGVSRIQQYKYICLFPMTVSLLTHQVIQKCWN